MQVKVAETNRSRSLPTTHTHATHVARSVTQQQARETREAHRKAHRELLIDVCDDVDGVSTHNTASKWHKLFKGAHKPHTQ